MAIGDFGTDGLMYGLGRTNHDTKEGSNRRFAVNASRYRKGGGRIVWFDLQEGSTWLRSKFDSQELYLAECMLFVGSAETQMQF